MSPTECATYNLKEIKKLSVDLNIDCTQCQDDPDLDCGSIDSYSVYVNYQGRGAFFQVLDPGVHDHPEDVLVSNFYILKNLKMRAITKILKISNFLSF